MKAASISPEALLAQTDFVEALARRLLRDAHGAKDVAQEALLAALERPPRAVHGLRAWLERVTRNAARQRLRGEGRRALRERDAARGELVAGPEAILEREAARAALVHALLALPEPSRTTLLLHYYEGESARAIAARLGVPLETVRTRIRRGLARLRAELGADGESGERAWVDMLALVVLPPGARSLPVEAAASPALLASSGGALAAVTALAGAGLLALLSRAPRDPSVEPPTAPIAGHERGDEGRAGDGVVAESAELVAARARASTARGEQQGAGSSRTAERGAAPRIALPRVELRARFVRPDGNDFALEGTLEMIGASGHRRESAVHGASELHFADLPPDVYTVRVRARDCVHREQTFDLAVRNDGRGSSPGDPERFEELVYVWPERWIAIVVRTPDGRSFEAIADEVGLERKRVLVDAFEARAQLDPPTSGAVPLPSGASSATFRTPPKYQAWQLPGSIVGSLELHEPPPLWVRLHVHGVPLEWQWLAPGARELVFTLDAAAFSRGFATLSLRVVDAPGGAPIAGARVTLKADTSAHRRGDHTGAATDAEGRARFERIVPGRYELAIEAGDALHQDLFDLAPSEVRELGEIVLAPSRGLALRVVDADGRPATAWIEVAPYRPGHRNGELYPPNLHRHTDAEGAFVLPMPAAVSIVRATLMDPRTFHPSDDRSPDFLLDPRLPPPEPLQLVLHEPLPVRFDVRPLDGARLEVRDALDLVVAEPRAEDDEPPSCELVPGRYRARLGDESGAVLDEREFELADAPLTVEFP